MPLEPAVTRDITLITGTGRTIAPATSAFARFLRASFSVFNTREKSAKTRAPKEEGIVEKGQAMTFGPGASKSRFPQLRPDLSSYPDRAARDCFQLAVHLGPCDQRELRRQFDLGASCFDRQPLNQPGMLR